MNVIDALEPKSPAGTPKRGGRMASIVLLLLVAGASFYGGLYVAHGSAPLSVSSALTPAVSGSNDWSLVDQVVDKVNSNHIAGPVDPKATLYGAARGAVAAAGDPYTEFFEPKDLKGFRDELKGSFGGIGAEIGKKDNAIVIVAPLPETPASRAGIKAQDVVYKIEGELTDGWTVEQAVDKIRGPKGTQVTITLYREGAGKPFDVTLTRETIEIKSVKYDLKSVGGKRVAVITLSRFGDDTVKLFDAAATRARNDNADAVIVDLRNNPGGYLQGAVDIASYWLKDGEVVVSEARRSGDPLPFIARGNQKLAGLKTILLINGGSASAAEILAGALHDNGQAQLVGEKSFGKGSVQELMDLPGGSAVKVTIAKWITPAGKNINKEGIKPDVESTIPADNKPGVDPQLDKALDLLK